MEEGVLTMISICQTCLHLQGGLADGVVAINIVHQYGIIGLRGV